MSTDEHLPADIAQHHRRLEIFSKTTDTASDIARNRDLTINKYKLIYIRFEVFGRSVVFQNMTSRIFRRK
jgi:hypothetical protein